MNANVIIGLLIPLLGTALGSACVFLLKKNIHEKFQKILVGFASGVMIAAGVWSLLLPAIEQSKSLGKLSFMPPAAGVLLGMGFLLLLDMIIPHLHVHAIKPEGLKSSFKETTMIVLAVTLHNIPEGMAVGVIFAGLMNGSAGVTLTGALALSIGIAIQNFPEGAIISMPLKSHGNRNLKSFLLGVLSGVVEPIAAFLTIAFTNFFVPLMPYVLSFAAGAMFYVVVEELIPEASEGSHSNLGTIGFAFGFVVMMILDIALA